MDNHQPQAIGTYRVVRAIGAGRFTQVYLVEDIRGQLWALKKIHENLIKQDPGFLQRFEREVRIQAGLKHPNVAGVRAFDANEGYLVIDYIGEKTLQDLLDNDYPDGMDLHTALDIIRPIEEALTYIHKDAGFAHLNVTPRNILIQETRTRRGSTERHIMLADFGLGFAIDSDGWADLNGFVGTPGYWSPRQRGSTEDKPGVLSDIYSLGAVIGVMLTGRKPQEVLDILRGTNKGLRSSLPLKVRQVLQRATEEDPRNRYASVKGLVTAFTRAVEDDKSHRQREGDFDRETTLTVTSIAGSSPDLTTLSSQPAILADLQTVQPLKIFYCYAHEDRDLRDRIDKHLAGLKRRGHIVAWYDREIQAGTVWEQEINIHLSTADIILLLVSADFVNSDYCYGKEMQRALEMHEKGEAYVLPILLRPMDWQDAPFAKLQLLPTGAKPITRWSDPEEALEDVAKQIRAIVTTLHTRQG